MPHMTTTRPQRVVAGIKEKILSGELAPGSLVVLQGLGSDLEDGHLPDEALAWSSNRQGALGVGPSLALTTLQPGLHTITLTVMDAGGQTASTSVKLFVCHRVFTPAVRK